MPSIAKRLSMLWENRFQTNVSRPTCFEYYSIGAYLPSIVHNP